MPYVGGLPGGLVVNDLPANAGDTGEAGSIPGSGRARGGGNGNPLQYSCLGKSHRQESYVGHYFFKSIHKPKKKV